MIKLRQNEHSGRWNASLYDSMNYFTGVLTINRLTPAEAVAEMHNEAEKLKAKIRKRTVALQKKMDVLQKDLEDVDNWLKETVVEEGKFPHL